MVLDIIVHFLTAYYDGSEATPVTNLWKIFKNYASGNMIFDMAATVPGFFLSVEADFYCFKLLRLMHARTVYGTISGCIRGAFIKFGLTKASAEKIGFTLDLILYLF